jgi:outer membrane biogenesis lipoprotein LolB
MKKFGLILSFFAFVMLFGCTKQEPAETQKQKR